jgi:3-oxoacyl-[acyl-carrier protein] reductase
VIEEGGSLAGRVAVVTGAAGAIGTALVRHFVAAGADVIATDLVDPDPASWDGSDQVTPVVCDVAEPSGIEQLVADAVRRHGRLDILVNNAGVYDTIASAMRIEPEQWDRDIQVNLSGPFYATRAVLPHMLAQRWGRIINISSISSAGAYKQASYGATKAGLLGLTSTVAAEFAPAGITANAVLPGLIATAKVRAAPADILAAAVDAIPAGHMGDVADIAELVTFLAGPAAGYINGAAIPVDGGAMLLQLRFSRPSSLGAGL